MAGRPSGPRVRRGFPGVALLIAGLVTACSVEPAPASTAPRELIVFAAASLRDPLAVAATVYEGATGIRLIIATDSSTALRVQLEQGAPADLFLSADTDNPEALAAAGMVDGAVVAFAGNQLSIVVPTDNPAGLASPADLALRGVAIVAAGDGVPISRYAERLVAGLATLPGYPRDFAAAYAANIVSREDNAQAILAKIELGEGDAGIVYATDAARSEAVAVLALPARSNVTATYAGAVIAGRPAVAAAHAFLDWLGGPDGQAILAGFGFQAPP